MFFLGLFNILCGIIIYLSILFSNENYVTQQIAQFLKEIEGAIFLCLGFILIGLSKIIATIKEISFNTKNNFKSNYTSQTRESKIIQNNANPNSIKTKEDLLKNPKIREEALLQRQKFGEEAYERYLENKADEFNL